LTAFAAVALSGCEIGKKGPTIDKYWYATVEKDKEGEKYVRIWGLTNEGIKASKTETHAVLPEEIGGYPVKILDAFRTMLFSDATTKSADLGDLTKITIEGEVSVAEAFFRNTKIMFIEIKQPCDIHSQNRTNSRGLAYIYADNLYNEGASTDDCTFKKSEIIGDYLIKNKKFYGYMGTESEISIPEGVESLFTLESYIASSLISIKFPKTITAIGKNMFSKSKDLERVSVYKGTAIEDDAFLEDVDIIEYEN
jgi:hypothetical protein